MSEISADAADAFWNKKRFKRGDTTGWTRIKGEQKVRCSFMCFFGTLIAQQVPRKDGTTVTLITIAGFFRTMTVKTRLNALGYDVRTYKGQLMLNGYSWDGGWVNPEEIHLGELDDKEDYDYDLQ